MKKFIHNTLGSIFWVADESAEDYKAAGHKLAAEAQPQEEAKTPKRKKTEKK